MAYGSAICQISWLLSFAVWIIVNKTCCKGKKGCPEMSLKDMTPLIFSGMISAASGINGCIALWMDSDAPAENNDLLKNFKTFIAMTLVINIFVSKQTNKRYTMY